VNPWRAIDRSSLLAGHVTIADEYEVGLGGLGDYSGYRLAMDVRPTRRRDTGQDRHQKSNGRSRPASRSVAIWLWSPERKGSRLDPSSQDGISAKMGIDATKPVSTEPMAFKRIHVKGVENVDLGRMLQCDPKAAFARMIAS
jgi:hypothetical protein